MCTNTHVHCPIQSSHPEHVWFPNGGGIDFFRRGIDAPVARCSGRPGDVDVDEVRQRRALES